jgi:heme exporter protein D
MTNFLSMNGYGFYVWSAYGATALLLAIELLVLRSRRRTVLAEARLADADAAPAPGAAE